MCIYLRIHPVKRLPLTTNARQMAQQVAQKYALVMSG